MLEQFQDSNSQENVSFFSGKESISSDSMKKDPLTYRTPTPLALPQLIDNSHGGRRDKDKELN